MHCGNEARFLLCAGFPNWVRLVGGGGFGQNGQKLHENYKINILGAKQWGDMEGQANFLVSGGDPPSPPPLEETLMCVGGVTRAMFSIQL